MSTDDNSDIIASLDEAIVRETERLVSPDLDADDKNKTMEYVERLHLIRKEALPDPTSVEEAKIALKKDKVKFKDFIPMIGSIGGILVIVVFESFGHTLTSKATAFVSKSTK